MSLIKRIFFKNTKIQTFFIARLPVEAIAEKVVLKQGKHEFDVSQRHAMICLAPFCVAVWLRLNETSLFDADKAALHFVKGKNLNARIKLSIIEKIDTETGVLLLYKVEKVKNYQLTVLHRIALFAYFLRAKTNTFYSRRVISALYSYPRSIIIVSYRDEEYYNIFPMDIHGYIEDEGLYLLGLRTTNVTLNKILETKKVVVCDSDTVDINTVYNLGKHSSTSPTKIADMPFGVTESEQFGFFVPDFTGSYKEIEIIENRKIGYHMLMVGKVINSKKLKEKSEPLYHIGFLQFQGSNYKSIHGLF